MIITGNSIKTGMVLLINDVLWVVVKTNAVKPGKGGAYNQVEMKNVFDGRKTQHRFRASETVERINLEQKTFQFLYRHDDRLVFMDPEDFEQTELPVSFLNDDALLFLEDNMTVVLERYEDNYISCTLPPQVTRTIVEAEPVIKGQTASSSYKPATLDNGYRIMVPPFIATDDRIIIDTSNFEYIKRAE